MTGAMFRRVSLAAALLCLLPLSLNTQAQSLQDLGTLGGTNSTAYGINANGQIVGTSDTTADGPHGFLYLTAPAYGFPAGMNDLGTMGGSFNGQTSSAAYAINSQGQIAGSSPVTLPLSTQLHAFLWTPGAMNGVSGNPQMVDLGTLGGTESEAWGINSQGQVVGWSTTTNDAEVHPFLWQPDAPNGTTGHMIDLGTLGGVSTGNHGFTTNVSINDAGQIVGETANANGDRHAFLWQPDAPNGTTGHMIDLGSPGYPASCALGINASGQVVGNLYDPQTGLNAGFLWQPTAPNVATGTLTPLDTQGALFSQAAGINTRGKIAGDIINTAETEIDALIWTPYSPNTVNGTIDTLGTLGGVIAFSNGINDLDQIVGASYTTGNSARHAFVVQKINTAPIANAGNDQQVSVPHDGDPNTNTASFTLDGTASSDPDNDHLTYQWQENTTVVGTTAALTLSRPAGVYTFTLTVTDANGASSSDSVQITVLPEPNTPPQANDQFFTTNEDTPLSITVSASDPEGDPITYQVTGQPQHGILFGTAPNLIYIPNYNVNGSDSFVVTVTDSYGASSINTIHISITPVNDPPVAYDAAFSTTSGMPLALGLPASDVDGDPLTYTIVTGPVHGTLTGTGSTRVYRAAYGFSGTDTFTFKVNDGKADSNIATVTITVTPFATIIKPPVGNNTL